MTLPASGPLSLSDIQTEFGGSNPISLSEYYAGGGLVPAGTSGTYGAVPSSGQISVQNFYGTTAYTPVYVEELFQTWLYNGNGGAQTITNGIDLSTKGGLVWVKDRTSANDHALVDTVRGAYNTLKSNTTDASASLTTIAGFNTTGFNLGGNVIANANGDTYVSWTLRKQPKFFDIVTFSGNGSNRTISHNLGSTPGCIFVKCTSQDTGGWQVYHRGMTSAAYSMNLNGTSQQNSQPTVWNSTAPTSTVFSVGTAATVNQSGDTYVAYLFAHDAGGFGLTGTDNVISCGSFTTNGSGNATVTLGYEPQFVLYKTSSTAEDWNIVDVMRGFNQTALSRLKPNVSNAEANAGGNYFFPTATGFTSANGWLTASQTYIYIAIRRGPMKVPTSGTSVFKPLTRTANNALAVTTGYGFAPDMMFSSQRSRTYPTSVYDKLRGNLQAYPSGGARFIETSSAGGESNAGNESGIQTFDNDGITFYTDSNGRVNFSGTYVYWIFGRAPSFFDQVCYTGTGANMTVSHNLGVVPELMIVKRRNTSGAWDSYCSALANTEYIVLDTTAAKATGATRWNSTTPTSSVFSVGTSTTTNASGGTYVAYLFATCAGVSKVGSYTGTGALQTVNCGFSSGARFVLIKRTDSTGDWYTYDSARGITSGNDPYLFLNSTAAEVTNTNYVDTDTTGFKVTAAAPAGLNASGGTYIFLAIA